MGAVCPCQKEETPIGVGVGLVLPRACSRRRLRLAGKLRPSATAVGRARVSKWAVSSRDKLCCWTLLTGHRLADSGLQQQPADISPWLQIAVKEMYPQRNIRTRGRGFTRRDRSFWSKRCSVFVSLQHNAQRSP